MALTIGNLAYQNNGSTYSVTGTIAFDSSYPTGGESLTAADVGLAVIEHIDVHPTSGLAFEYDYTNALLLAYEQGITTGATAVTAVATVTGALIVDSSGTETTIRAGGVTAASTTYQLGALKQVASTTDLSGITGVRFRATGY